MWVVQSSYVKSPICRAEKGVGVMRWWPVGWWPSQDLSFSVDVREKVSVKGIPKLPTKKQFPVLWRWFRWRWRVISVRTPRNGSYRVFFVAGNTAMCAWWRITASHVAVRVGPEDVCFYFQHRDGHLLPARPVGGLFTRRQLRKEWSHAKKI